MSKSNQKSNRNQELNQEAPDGMLTAGEVPAYEPFTFPVIDAAEASTGGRVTASVSEWAAGDTLVAIVSVRHLPTVAAHLGYPLPEVSQGGTSLALTLGRGNAHIGLIRRDGRIVAAVTSSEIAGLVIAGFVTRTHVQRLAAMGRAANALRGTCVTGIC